MAIIGITGLPGTGKSYISSYLNTFEEFDLLDADKVGHVLLTNKEIVSYISKNYNGVVVDGVVNRKKLAAIIFSSKEKYQTYNTYISNFMKSTLFEESFNMLQVSKNVIIDAALIFEWGIEDIFDKIIYCSADNKKRLSRIESRGDNIKDYQQRETFLLDEEIKKQKSNYVILNNYDDSFFVEIENIKKELCNG